MQSKKILNILKVELKNRNLKRVDDKKKDIITFQWKMSEDESHRSVSKEIDAELPDTFTNNIISMIQNKQQETPAEDYVEEVSEPD